ncbi:MAG: sugar phosphate isomerase/epimerase [Lawsonibacter sp.]|nr:sugar phosphate isomerase/epimerase [Lawsonibacter sp.]
MKFSATVTLQYDTPFSPFSAAEYVQGLDWIKASGLEGAELCISHYNGLDLGLVKAQLEERGLSCSTISTGQARGLEGLSLTGVSQDLQEKTQQRFRQHIDAAAYLGSKVTIGLMRGGGSVSTAQEDLKALREAMLPLADYASQKGVTLLLEAINRYETAMLNSAEATLDFVVHSLGNPDCVGILWDVFHANIEDIEFRRSIDAMGKKLQHVHLADSNRKFPGYGHLDIAGVLKYIEDSGYGEYASFECLNLPSVKAVREETGPWVASVRAVSEG